MLHRLRVWIRAFFGFNRSQTNGFLILIPSMLIALFAEPVYQAWYVRQPIDQSADKHILDSLLTYLKEERPPTAKGQDTTIHAPVLFPFDPNLASSKELKNLGFPDFIAQRIVNYRSKGGRFKSSEDLKRIYGIDTTWVNTLHPYARFSSANTHSKASLKEDSESTSMRALPIDLNTCDSLSLLSVYGIGPKLSSRIIRYRNRLGGFVSMHQLTEVYGLDTIVLQELRKRTFIEENFVPKKINLNTASEKELLQLPYIKSALARAITTYRFQHGAYNSVDALLKIERIDNPTFEKIKPYLTVTDP
jgi:competence ComEA-like helix-hairpin-helix protein